MSERKKRLVWFAGIYVSSLIVFAFVYVSAESCLAAPLNGKQAFAF